MNDLSARSGAGDAGVLRRLARIGRDLLRSLRMEATRAVGHYRRRPLVARYLADHEVRKLNIGCGGNALPGWLNGDIRPRGDGVIYLDATESLPLPDASVHYVFSEHLVQDLTYPELQRFLAEQARVLVPGGRIRISGPDLMQVVLTFGAEPDSLAARYRKWAIAHHFKWADGEFASFTVNQLFEQCRGFVPDRDTLRHALSVAGFVDIITQRVGRSDDPALRDLERHGTALGDEAMNEFETVVLEATKSPARNRPSASAA